MTADVWSGEWLMPMKNSQENKINTCFCESPHVRAKSTRQKSRIFNFKSPEPGEQGSSLLALYKSCSWMVHTCRTEAKGRIPKMQIKTDIHSRFTTLSNGDKWINRLEWGPLSFNWHQGIYHKEDSAFWASRTFSRTVTGGHWSSLLYESLEPALCDQWKQKVIQPCLPTKHFQHGVCTQGILDIWNYMQRPVYEIPNTTWRKYIQCVFWRISVSQVDLWIEQFLF